MRSKRKKKNELKNKKPVKSVRDKKKSYDKTGSFRCAHCGNQFSNKANARRTGGNFATVEHIYPKSTNYDFVHTEKNLCLLCEKCNGFKRDKLVVPSTFYKYLNKECLEQLDAKLKPMYDAERDSSKKLSQNDIEWYDMFRKVERQFRAGNLYDSKKLVKWVHDQSHAKRKGKLASWKNGYMKHLHPTWSFLYADRMLNVYCKLQRYYNSKDYFTKGYDLDVLIGKLDIESKYSRYRILLHLYETYGLYSVTQFEFLLKENDETALKACTYFRKQYKISKEKLLKAMSKI